MATSFPSSLDSFTNPSSSDAMDSVSVPHATQHSDLNDAVEALQAKVGADSSAVASSHDYKIAQLEAISPGKILQVVRATDTTLRSTTSGSSVDVTGMSVTITPQSTSSTVIIIAVCAAQVITTAAGSIVLEITDASNNLISGGSTEINNDFNIVGSVSHLAYDSPATTSATTYKLRFKKTSNPTEVRVLNNLHTGQMYALEVSA